MTVDERFPREPQPEPEADLSYGTRNEIDTTPVTDWASDFSHLEPEWAADPYHPGRPARALPGRAYGAVRRRLAANAV
jgi:hypothetical protein